VCDDMTLPNDTRMDVSDDVLLPDDMVVSNDIAVCDDMVCLIIW